VDEAAFARFIRLAETFPRRGASSSAVSSALAALEGEDRQGGRSMESQHFDRITRIWATSSRRRVLAGLAAAAMTGLRPLRAGAACDPASCAETDLCGFKECVGIRCETFAEPAGTVCRPAANECDLAEVCNGASIACPTDRKKANGSSCSSDGNSCTFDVCQNGQCTHPEIPDRFECDDDGNACTLNICLGGVCSSQAFVDGAECPDGVCCGGECVDTQSDEANCGSCDVVCSAGQVCCDGGCIDPQNNKQHCGQCGKRCGRGACRNGRCKRRQKKKR
jgi:hypothetical protein